MFRREDAARRRPSLAVTDPAANVLGADEARWRYTVKLARKESIGKTCRTVASLGPSAQDERKSIPAGIAFQYLPVLTSILERPAKWALLACGDMRGFAACPLAADAAG